MKLTEFDYELPEELIAQHPLAERDQARLLVSVKDRVEHRLFSDIGEYLESGDTLVLNDSRVIPARVFGVKEDTKARIEILLLRKLDELRWECLFRPLKKIKFETKILIRDGLYAMLEETRSFASPNIVRFSAPVDFRLLESIAVTPLPPYIKRDYRRYTEDEKRADDEAYQTVYAREYGSVASPTAGLHFTPGLLDRLREKGVRTAFVTLDVSYGTFRPVKTDEIEDHKMHAESFSLDERNAEIVRSTPGRVVATGTTAARVLETVASKFGEIRPDAGLTDIFIRPGYEFQAIDGLITNFHLPRSTLLMLVAAFTGLERMRELYAIAVNRKYRFYSFGDAMLLLP